MNNFSPPETNEKQYSVIKNNNSLNEQSKIEFPNDKKCSDNLKDFINQLLNADPTKRLDVN